ncbi:imidazole glycerol phosphate synthase amidotransferase subunit [alpha proteobacterium U9-1i]|nr:imidazole glycerol phosphate synthase amidotransferase subunit [alpha proteobacterium U9-1i]
MIVILNYDMGNVGSIGNMFKRLGFQATVSRDPDVIAKADRLIVPGVGAYDQGMENLDRMGLRQVLDDRVLGARVPVLGICLGMQLMTKGSEEGSAKGLGWIDADTVHFKRGLEQQAPDMRLPHIGWNFVDLAQRHELVQNLPEDPRFYFVHTYRVECADPSDVLLTSEYHGVPFTAAFARRNIAGIQCHPEKSHKFGMQVFMNFARWTPTVAEERQYA